MLTGAGHGSRTCRTAKAACRATIPRRVVSTTFGFASSIRCDRPVSCFSTSIDTVSLYRARNM